MNVNIVVLGFLPSDLPEVEGVRFTVLGGMDDDATSGGEKYLFLSRLGSTCQAIIFNTMRNLADYEVILLHTAYAEQSPLFGIGTHSLMSDVVYEMMANHFDSLEQVIAHLRKNYLY